jgi:hypothetical protein
LKLAQVRLCCVQVSPPFVDLQTLPEAPVAQIALGETYWSEVRSKLEPVEFAFHKEPPSVVFMTMPPLQAAQPFEASLKNRAFTFFDVPYPD